MQTVRKPQAQPSKPRPKDDASLSRSERRLPAAYPGSIVLTLVLLAVWAWFMQSLEGIDIDTAFLAVFCTLLSVFILKALATAIQPHTEG